MGFFPSHEAQPRTKGKFDDNPPRSLVLAFDWEAIGRRVQAVTKSFLGLHALQNPNGLGDLERAGSALTVSVDNIGIIQELHQINPDAIAIYRMFTPDISVQEGWRDRRDPREYASWYVNQFLSQLEANHAILMQPNTYIVGGNEPVLKIGNTDDFAGLVWLSQMEAERCKIMAGLGLKCCVFNFPTGFPSIGSWSLFKEAYAAFKQYGAIVGIHGYYTNPPEPENAFRHEQIISVADANGGTGLRFAYTEWGRIDYRLHTSDEQYLSEIVSADNRFRQYPRLLGAALFTLGGTMTWDNYRPTPNLIAKLAVYLKTQTGDPVTIPPVPTPNPLPIPVPPPTAYKDGDPVIVTTTELNVREQAGPSQKRLGSVLGGMAGQVISSPVIVGDGGVWVRAVWWERKLVGWCNASYLRHG